MPGSGACQFSSRFIRNPWQDYQAVLFHKQRADGFPIATWELALAAHLFDVGYPTDLASAILDHANQVGSLECCEQIQDCHRAMAERLLPESPSSTWSYHDQWVWTSEPRYIPPLKTDEVV